MFVALFSACTDPTNPPEHNISASDYKGTWHVQENCSKNAYTVNITIDSGDSSVVYISNFGQLGNDFNAKANVDNELITVLKQSIDGTEVSGNGTLSNEKITWSFSINDGTDLTECTAVYTK